VLNVCAAPFRQPEILFQVEPSLCHYKDCSTAYVTENTAFHSYKHDHA